MLTLYSDIFTICNSSCGKVMFSQGSVILSTGEVYIPLGRHPPGRHPPKTATAVDGTHPTGMHSCCSFLHYLYFKMLVNVKLDVSW